MMAMNPLYQNQLDAILRGNFSGTEGGRFIADQGLQAAQRGMAAQRGSGNVLAELTKLGAGYAAADRGGEIDRLTRLIGQEQQFGLGEEQNRLTGIRDANAFTLGREQNANTRRIGDQNFGVGLYNARNAAQRNAWDYDLGLRRNDSDWLGAQTNWFNAQSQDRARTAGTQQSWWDRLN